MSAPVRPWYACNADPCTCPKPVTIAPELSPAEAARVAQFDAAPEPPEIVVERVAMAIYEADEAYGAETDPDFHQPVEWRYNHAYRDDYRRRAAAAIAAMEHRRDA